MLTGVFGQGSIRTPVRAAKARVAGVLGISDFPGSRRWVGASLIDAIGTGLLKPLAVLYFTLHIGLSPASVGLGLTIAGLVTIAVAPFGGALIDGFGGKPVMIGYSALCALAYAGFGLVTTWPEFLIVVTAAAIGTSALSTARKALLADITTGSDRVTAMASQRSLRNVGFGIGGLLASAALAVGGSAYLVVVYGDALSFVAAIVLLAGLPVPARTRVMGVGRRSLGGLRQVLADRRYLRLTGLGFFTNVHATALEVALPLWVALHTHAPRAVIGILFTLNTVIVVVSQVRLTSSVRGLGDVPRAERRAAFAIALCAAAYLAAHFVGATDAIIFLVAGSVLHTGAEMFASAGEWVTSIDFADDVHRGAYLSVYSIAGDLQDAIGPTIVTSLLLVGTAYLWPVLAALMCLGALGTAAMSSAAAVTHEPSVVSG
jgi:Major Facilitator Superfamily